MTTIEWLTIVAILVGPIVAVGITLWIEDRRKKHEAKLITLRILMSTRDLPSDPSYQIAVKLVPIEFHGCSAVIDGHREFLEATNADTEGKTPEQLRAINDRISVKLTRLLFEMSRAAGLKIRETDIQTGSFGTRGFFYRDEIMQDSQRAMRDVANILWMQTRLLAGETWEQITACPSSAETEGATPPKIESKKKS